jgi:two-component sensor histidine kinase/CHASE3 domain sensor protein
MGARSTRSAWQETVAQAWAQRIGYGLIVAGLLLLLLVAAFIMWLTYGIDRSAMAGRQLLDWRDAGFQIMDSVLDAETGQRGFLLTGDRAYLAPYKTALERLPARLQALRELTPDHPDQLASIAALETVIQIKLKEIEETVALEADGRHADAVAIVKRELGKVTMDTIRSQVKALQNEQSARLDEIRRSARNLREWLMRGAVAALLLSGVLALFGLILLRRQLSELRRDTRNLGVRKLELETMVAERTANLEEARAELQRERDQVKALLRDMNHRVGNSLQLVSSFLSLQARKTRDPGASAALRSAQARVQAVALAQRRLRLHEGASEDQADAAQLLGGLIEDLRAASAADSPITLELDAMPFVVKSQDAVSIGVIVGELVNNAMKYALPDGMPGTIRVSLIPAQNGSPARLIVEDDGIGFVDSPDGAGGLGSEVVNALATGLNAAVTREAARQNAIRPGHKVILTFG